MGCSKCERRDAARERLKNCIVCGEDCCDQYIVNDEVWAAAGFAPKQGVAHLVCLEFQLGRRLTRGDFPSVPVNRAFGFGYVMGICDQRDHQGER